MKIPSIINSFFAQAISWYFSLFANIRQRLQEVGLPSFVLSDERSEIVFQGYPARVLNGLEVLHADFVNLHASTTTPPSTNLLRSGNPTA